MDIPMWKTQKDQWFKERLIIAGWQVVLSDKLEFSGLSYGSGAALNIKFLKDVMDVVLGGTETDD